VSTKKHVACFTFEVTAGGAKQIRFFDDAADDAMTLQNESNGKPDHTMFSHKTKGLKGEFSDED
jgi:hypothetical protein